MAEKIRLRLPLFNKLMRHGSLYLPGAPFRNVRGFADADAARVLSADDTHLRLRELARRCSMSISKLMEGLAAISIPEFNAETRFRALAARGSAKKGLALLDKLDAAFAKVR
jgi:hypothetical protein